MESEKIGINDIYKAETETQCGEPMYRYQRGGAG